MKQKSTLILKSLFSASILAMAFTACKKDKNPETPKNAKLSIIHASPGNPELSFYVNGQKANTSTSLTYSTTIPYADIKPGSQVLSVTKKGASEVLAKSSFDLKSANNFSVYVAGTPTNTVLVFAQDDLSAPAAGKAKVRFVNMSPNAGSLDFSVEGKTVALASNQDFKSVTGYSSIDPGNEVTFEIKQNGKTEVLTNLPKVKIEQGKIYTLWAKGIIASADATTKLGLGMIKNN